MILPSASPVSWLLALAAALAYAAPAAAASRLGAAASRNALLVAWVLHGALLVWGLWGEAPRFGFAPALSMTAWLVLTVYAVERQLFPQMRARWMLAALGAATIVLALLFYNLVLWLMLRDPGYFWYLLHTGAFVLVLVGVIAVQAELSGRLDAEMRRRQAEQAQRQALEQALAGPLAAGRVTLVDGRIGIRGNVLFALNSAQLQPQGRELLRSLAAPLAAYMEARDEILMVSGFTDDRPVLDTNRRFADNWDLSAQRALTVTRALIEEGVPSSSVFAAAFGSEQPAASNDDADGRSRNRRVEMAPVPKVAGKLTQKATAADG